MAVTLNTTGITFSDGTSTSTNLIPAGTLMLFQQTSSPTGWTKQTTHNDKALRVVSGTASSGGSTAFTSVFASRTPSGTLSGGEVGATTLSTAQMPSHTHTSWSFGNYGAWGMGNGANAGSAQSGAAGGGGSHTHTFTSPSFAGTAMDFSVQYVDLIIASKN